MKRTLLSTLVSAALVTLAAAPSVAQVGGPGGEGPVPSAVERPQARHFAQRQHEGQRASRLPSERVEARLAYLKTALKINDAQQAQWDAFAATLRKHAREADQRVQSLRAEGAARGEKRTPPTAIERMERGQQRLAAAYTRQSETLAAAKPLYAALSPEQQKVADELFAPRRHAGSRRGGRPRA
ncbi:MAG TPA: Spy/CpxP family protein refolding chaperone [Burkholderiales bacterium]|nr:Spy/CpxP family protein refolding chaperone [Burkholderiales bacterium]